VKAHATELGEQGKELLGHIEAKARLIRADEWASKVANDPSFQLADGNLNTLKIEQELQKTVPAGQERLLYRAAVSHRFEQVRQGTEAKDKANWDSLLNDYHSMGRSYYDVVRNSPSWKTATGTQQEHLYQRFLADQREKRGEPPSEQQLSAFGKISYDIAARADFWGTADQRELENQADYHTLNEPLQKHLIDMVSNAHKERSSISGQIQFVDKVALQRAQTDGHPLSGTAGRRYENLDPDQQQSWDVVRDGVHARVQTWKNQNPKATYVPVQVINEAVDAETRNFVVKDGRWYVPGSTRKVTPAEDAGREPAGHRAGSVRRRDEDWYRRPAASRLQRLADDARHGRQGCEPEARPRRRASSARARAHHPGPARRGLEDPRRRSRNPRDLREDEAELRPLRGDLEEPEDRHPHRRAVAGRA
jgi:hypothetical protein